MTNNVRNSGIKLKLKTTLHITYKACKAHRVPPTFRDICRKTLSVTFKILCWAYEYVREQQIASERARRKQGGMEKGERKERLDEKAQYDTKA